MKSERIFWGALFIIAGVFMIISRLGYLPEVNVISLLLTIFLVAVIIKSIPRLNFSGILFPIAFICMIYDNELGLTAITPWTVLIAAAFGSIGLSMIFHKHIKWSQNHSHHEDFNFEEINVEDESNVMLRTSFGASVKYINTNSFEKGDFECSFGSMTIYFDNAVMRYETAVVRLDASFAGIQLYIPKNWKVDNKINNFLGGITEKNKRHAETTHTLTLVGEVTFSGVEIIYV